MERRPKMVQLYTYLHQNEAQRITWFVEKKGRGLSETLRGILYSWMNENDIPYPEENPES